LFWRSRSILQRRRRRRRGRGGAARRGTGAGPRRDGDSRARWPACLPSRWCGRLAWRRGRGAQLLPGAVHVGPPPCGCSYSLAASL